MIRDIRPARPSWEGCCAACRARPRLSFIFLAIPTILGATVLTLFKARHSLNFDDLAVIGVGSWPCS